ncbi:DUF433 domain-containing protein [Pseudomonas sp. MOB-449]|nr:DUF433 domain-containing protein [Pseudomonas sp. MOB-449]
MPSISRLTYNTVTISLQAPLLWTAMQLRQLAAIHATVHADPEVQGGQAVFRGTRLPVAMALSRLDADESFESLHDDYPYLTREKLELARVYLGIFPARPSPPRPPAPVGWRLVARGVLS